MADEHDEELLLDTPLDDEREGEAGDADDISIEIEGEEPFEETPLVKQLRQRERDQAREIAELRRNTQAKAPIVVGDKPTLDEYEWDADKFEAALDAWKERDRQAKDRERAQTDEAQARNHAFERSVSTYRGKAAQLGVRDFDACEEAVKSVLPELLQSAVIQYASDPAKVVYALGKHPGRLAALAAEPDPIKFVLAINELERNLKVVNRRKPPEPEADSIQRGSAPVSRDNSDKKLAELEKEADRTGDRSKIIAFKRAQKEKAK